MLHTNFLHKTIYIYFFSLGSFIAIVLLKSKKSEKKMN